MPSKSQLQSFLTKLRTERFGDDKINLATLEKWLQENTLIPIDKTDPFVVDYKVLTNEQNPNESEFRFLVSSKQLLELAINVKKIHTDATYKLVWQNFPVFLVGTTDEHRQFHIFGFAVCTTEAEINFSFIFNALNKGVKTLFNIDIDPIYLICDAAKAIDNGFAVVYGRDGKITIMCWSHMRRAVSKKLSSFFRDQMTQNEVLRDIDHLQLAKTSADFDKAANLFVQKWRLRSKEFIDYFTKEWLNKNRFWYEGVARNVPSTNNAQEATHKAIKDRQTLRNRFDIGKFREVLFQMVKSYSIEYSNGIREYHHKPLIDLPVWTDAYNWAKTNQNITISNHRNCVKHVISLIGNEEIDESLQWESFDNFRKIYFAKCTVTFPTPFNRSTWDKGHCDCSEFFKKYICMHVVGIALRMKYTEAPPEAKNVPIGSKRKRGRPALAKPAFTIQ